MQARLIEYRNLVKKFVEAGYGCIPFVPEPPRSGALLLRHDIDFDLRLAHDMAVVEHELGVRSTYFLMLRSASYNIFEKENAAFVARIGELGHHLSLHFDPTLYEDFNAGLKLELKLLALMSGRS